MVTSDWLAEYRALTTTGGMVTLQDWSQVQLTGNDRAKLLQNMCTNDISRLEPEQMCEAFLLDVKGKVVAHVLVVARTDCLTLLAVPGQGQRIIKHLDRYIIREDVQLADVGNEFKWHITVGSGAETAESCPMVRCHLLWPGGNLLRTAKGAASPCEEFPTVDIESPVWTALRVESFFPLFGRDFDESHLPQEINRDAQAISFVKGCYLGQETVARIDALGHVNKKLVLLKFSGEQVPAVETKLTSGGQEVGSVTTACWSPRLEAPLAIAFVRLGSNEVGSRLESEAGSAEVIEPAAGIEGSTIR